MSKRIWVLLCILVLFSPLGLISENSAWGEWENSYYEKILGFIPEGIAHTKSVEGIIPDYSITAIGSVVGYYISAVVGIVLLFGIYLILWKMVKHK